MILLANELLLIFPTSLGRYGDDPAASAAVFALYCVDISLRRADVNACASLHTGRQFRVSLWFEHATAFRVLVVNLRDVDAAADGISALRLRPLAFFDELLCDGDDCAAHAGVAMKEIRIVGDVLGNHPTPRLNVDEDAPVTALQSQRAVIVGRFWVNDELFLFPHVTEFSFDLFHAIAYLFGVVK